MFALLLSPCSAGEDHHAQRRAQIQFAIEMDTPPAAAERVEQY